MHPSLPSLPVFHWHGVDLRWAYTDLLRGIHRRTGCMHRAYDVLHDALVRLALVGGRTRIEQPNAYLRTVVGSVLADAYHDQARWLPMPEPGDAFAGPDDWAPSTEHLADLRQRLTALQRLLDCLPPRCREVFWLFRVDGCTQQEIAVRLGITPKIVGRHVMRALVDLRIAREALL